MKNSTTYLQKQKEIRLTISSKFSDLVQLKKAGDEIAFNKMLLDILPELRNYINQRLNAAIHKGHFSKGKYKADDFIDQLFIEVYDNLEEINDEDAFTIWLFKKTNELLEEAIEEEEYDDLFLRNIDEYSKPEWDEMQEKYSVEADGDLVMKEDLDDISYHHTEYLLNHVFVEDNEKELIEKLDSTLSKEDINRHIAMVLHNLPQPMQTAFELFTKQSFTLSEIAEIMKRDIKEVEKLLNEARKGLYTSLFNRHMK